MKSNKVHMLRTELEALAELVNKFPHVDRFNIIESSKDNLAIEFDIEIDYSVVGQFTTDLIVENK
jgi:hypothetical protein